jgi:type VI secretion system FHA domain protein
MPLTLEVVGKKAAQMGGAARKVFQTGGTIGRLRDNDWVLPDEYISGHHAKILFSNGTFLIEDTSTNGVFINSPQNRLARGQPYALRNGDTVFIDDYEVRVALSVDAAAYSPPAARAPLIPDDPIFGDDPGAFGAPESTDPLKLLGLQDARSLPPGPSAAGLERNSPLSQHYRPPAAAPPPPPPPAPAPRAPRAAPASGVGLIPDDYDPFADTPLPAKSPPRPVAIPASVSPRRQPPAPAPAPVAAPPPAQTVVSDLARASAAAARPTTPAPPKPVAPIRNADRAREAAADAGLPAGGLDFAAMLAAAGIDSIAVTPELSAKFGQILRVVVEGLMDVLRAREKIKDEFRMRMTTFKQADNNPLKFSANVEDALHNLLVKRNAAYLGPVEAFEDAFQDVRNHQMAMLAGMRVAYEAMLAEFEPARLQEEFDRHIKSGSFLSGPGKLKYWELYRNRFHDMVKDADTSFRQLFGDEFAKAYEQQLVRLKTVNRADRR